MGGRRALWTGPCWAVAKPGASGQNSLRVQGTLAAALPPQVWNVSPQPAVRVRPGVRDSSLWGLGISPRWPAEEVASGLDSGEEDVLSVWAPLTKRWFASGSPAEVGCRVSLRLAWAHPSTTCSCPAAGPPKPARLSLIWPIQALGPKVAGLRSGRETALQAVEGSQPGSQACFSSVFSWCSRVGNPRLEGP